MKRSKEELLGVIKNILGDRTDDDALGLLEDVSDSYPDKDWEKEYQDLDNSWRQRYIERFGLTTSGSLEPQGEDVKQVEVPLSETDVLDGFLNENPYEDAKIEDLFE